MMTTPEAFIRANVKMTPKAESAVKVWRDAVSEANWLGMSEAQLALESKIGVSETYLVLMEIAPSMVE